MNPLNGDLEFVLENCRDDFGLLRGNRLLITGATGFVGSWLMETLLWANQRLGLGCRVVALTRSPARYAETHPHLASDPAVELAAGDVRSPLSSIGLIDGCIHAATPASARMNAENPLEMLDTVIDGMRNVLLLSAQSGRIPLLFASSGAVYGQQPTTLQKLDEGYLGGPDSLSPSAAYHEGKRVAELMGAIASASGGISFRIARMFAFVGPYLPLDAHFAIGNFIGDGLAGRALQVQGDGTAVRSYLYGSDMAIWLWRIFIHGTDGRAYNVGSEHALSVAELAARVAEAFEPPPVIRIRGESTAAAARRYVPSTARARGELGLEQRVDLETAIRRTIAWHRVRISDECR
jgi:dTDP-glucose 4,6-dehydratase